MTYTTIINPDELEQHLEDPQWVIVDCRFDLQNPEWGFSEYQKSHIPGAVYAHLDRDLAGPVTAQTGRHPLPDPAVFVQRLSSWGIDKAKQVVAYDTAGGAYAARLWWMLRQLGHQPVAVLNGGFPRWLAEGRPVRGGVEIREPAQFTGTWNPDDTLTVEDVDQIRLYPHWRLIDARSLERYRGENEPIDPVAGHIPGAVHRFHGQNLRPDGTFLSPEELREQFTQLLGDVPPANTAVYCGSGVTSCHHLLAMEIAGLPGARLYAGSWSEWIRDPNRTVALGDNDPSDKPSS